MKATTILEVKEPVFEPVTIKVTFESIEELQNMWHRLNESDRAISGLDLPLESHPYPVASRMYLFSEIDEALENIRIKGLS